MGVKDKVNKNTNVCFLTKKSLTISCLLEFLIRGLHKVNIPKPLSNEAEQNRTSSLFRETSLNTWIVSWIASGEFFHEV